MDESTPQLAEQADSLLRKVGKRKRKREKLQKQLDDKIQELKDKLGPEIERLKQEEETASIALIGLVVPNFEKLAYQGTKTIKLRSGEISLRRGKPRLDITDNKLVLRQLRRLRKLTQFTKQPERVLLKEALKKDPDLVARLKGAEIVQEESVVIKPSKSQGEIIRTTDRKTIPMPLSD